MRQSTKTTTSPPGASVLFYRAALPLSSRTLNYVAGIIRRHRGLDRVPVAEAEPRAAGPPGPGLPAQRRDVRRAGGRVRGRHGHGLAVRERDRGAARGPGAEAAQGGPGREEGRVRLRGPGRHAHPDRPGRRGPAVLLRQAQEARDEPAGHRQPRRRHPVGVRGAARLGPRQEGRVDLGRPATNWRPPAWSRWPTRATRAAPTRKSRTGERTSRNHRKKPTAPTRSSAHPAKGQTPSSRTGGSSASSAAAPGAPGNSPRPSTPWRSMRHNQDEKGSVAWPFRWAGGVPIVTSGSCACPRALSRRGGPTL